MVGKEFASFSPPPPAWPRYGSSELPDSGVGFAPGQGRGKTPFASFFGHQAPSLTLPYYAPPIDGDWSPGGED